MLVGGSPQGANQSRTYGLSASEDSRANTTLIARSITLHFVDGPRGVVPEDGASCFSVPMTRSIEGHAIACVKHFAFNSIDSSRFLMDVQAEPLNRLANL